jgi:hypothetical protein
MEQRAHNAHTTAEATVVPRINQGTIRQRGVSVGGGLFGYFLAKQKVTKAICKCNVARKKPRYKIGALNQLAHFFFPNIFFNTKLTTKLTAAPTAARIAVFTKSSALIFAKRIVIVPPAVPVFKKDGCCILVAFVCNSRLAHAASHRTSHS